MQVLVLEHMYLENDVYVDYFVKHSHGTFWKFGIFNQLLPFKQQDGVWWKKLNAVELFSALEHEWFNDSSLPQF